MQLFNNRYICRNITSTLFSTLALSIATSSYAATEDSYQLGQIIVNPSLAIGSSFSLSQTDFERSGARSLDEALRFIPSLNVRNGADGTPRIDIRGLRTRQIKLLVNGIPLNSTNDGQFDPTLIPTFAIDSINLRAGASSVLYGDGGMGGVLDIHTRSGFDGLQSGGKAELGSDHYWQTNAYTGYGDAKNDFFLSAGVRARDAFSVSNDFDPVLATTAANYQDDNDRNNSDYRRVNFMGSYNRQVTDKLRLGLFINHFDGDYGKPPTVFNNGTDDFAQKAKYERTEDQQGTSFQVGADYDFTDDWAGKLWFFNNHENENSAGYDDNNYNTIIKKNSFIQRDKTDIRGAHAQLNGMVGSDTQLAFSMDQRRESFDSQQTKCNAGTCNNSSKYVTTNVNKDINVRSYGFEVTQPLAYDLTLVTGIGYHQLDKDGGSNDNTQSAQLALSKAFNANTSVYASYGRKVDAPTIKQLYDASSGNDALGFQRANHYEVGINNNWQNASLDVAAYHSIVYDFIEKDNANQYMNRQKMELEGIDMSGMIQATDQLALRASLGLLHATDKSANADSTTLQYRPKSKLSLQADYDISNNITLNGSFQRIGEQAYFSRVDPTIYRKLSAFNLVSAKLSYALPKQLGSVYVGADNLFNEDYSTSYGFPQAGRFFYTGVKIDFK